jgi:hypothetical protein
MKDEINELATISKNKRELCREVDEFKKGY